MQAMGLFMMGPPRAAAILPFDFCLLTLTSPQLPEGYCTGVSTTMLTVRQ